MSDFYWGIIIGMFVGTFFGVFIIAILRGARDD